MSAYYNELDPFAAAWLRELIKAGLIADGEVDERSIVDIDAGDLAGFQQCHFFAGIGGWSYALRLAGWPDDRAVWTGSCPCQPFLSAGAQAGGHDPRDLWPVWFKLIAECRPDVVFGEQVEAAIGHGWLDRVCDDLEAADYAIGACDLPGPCVGAFDIRPRLWFVADAASHRTHRHAGEDESPRRACRPESECRGQLGNADQSRPQGRRVSGHSSGQLSPWATSLVEWIPCADGKARPVESGLEPLAARLPGDVGRLRGYGNAIKPQVAQAFIEAYLSIGERVRCGPR